jgi:hypothetical protein
MEFKKSDPEVTRLVTQCYPGYRGRRKVKVEAKTTYRVHDYWDGGSRTYATFVNLSTYRRVDLETLPYEHQLRGNPFNLPIGTLTMEPGTAVVENVIFRGKDLGIRIYVHPDDLNKFGG